ncbi:glycoside hydrolase family 88 protein [Georgenia alba]|uniref:Glycoside hydrolase family 88 protein n=1 Tax=Georgenia alba TaxID=2233858 RepID=A0ABW2Q5H0_9MICO
MSVDGTVPPQDAVWSSAALAHFREEILAHEAHQLNTGWEDVLVPLGLELAGRAFGDATMRAWVRTWVEYHLGVATVRQSVESYRPQRSGEPLRGVVLSPYCGEWGVAMVLALVEHPRAMEAAREIADHICDDGLRARDGALLHGPFSLRVWVDTLYYSAVPLARVYAATGEERYAREAIRQCLLHAEHLRDPSTGDFVHDADPVTGQRTASPWSRGNGWIVMALADTLRHIPHEMHGWSEVMETYRSLVAAMIRVQHPSGLWRIVPGNDEAHLETSGSAMIATGIAVGLAEEWLDPSLAGAVQRTWRELPGWIDKGGRLQGCQTPAGHGGWETHKKSSLGSRTYGDGSLLRLAAELRGAALI